MKEQPQPQFRRIIERPRLINQLEESDARTIMLIAPAGYGKTTLLEQWSKRHPPDWWYAADQGSADLAQLATDIAATFETTVPGLKNEVAQVVRTLSNPARHVRDLVDTFACRLVGISGQSVVIDDYHFIGLNPYADTFVHELCDRARVRLLVGSRLRPSWATARAEIYGRVIELGPEDLALTPEESEDVLADAPSTFRKEFLAQANGWPAVIGLAALAKSQRRAPTDAVSSTLFRFFAEELFSKAAPQLQQDLLLMALQPGLSPDLLEAQFGNRVSGLLVDATGQGFVTTTEQHQALHPLIREFLLSKCAERNDAHEQVSKAVSLSLQLGAWDNAFELIRRFERTDLLDSFLESAFTPLVRTGRIGTLEQVAAFARLHSIAFSASATLIGAEIALRDGSFVRAEALATRAAEGLGPSHVLAAHAHWIAGEAAQLGANYGVAVERFRCAQKVASDEGDLRDALWGLMITSILSEMDSAAEVEQELRRRRDASPIDLLVATNAALLARRYRSGFAEPLDVDSALHHLEAVGNPRICTSFMYSLSYEKLLRADYEGSHHLSTLTLEQASKYQLSWVLPHAEWVLAAASVGVRNFAEANWRLRRLERAADSLDDTLVRLNTAALRARVCLALQRTEEAHEVLKVDDSGTVNAAMRAELTAMRALVLALLGEITTAELEASRAAEMSTSVEVRAYVACARAISQPVAETAATALTVARNLDVWDPLVATMRACPPLLEEIMTDAGARDDLQAVLRRSNDFDLARRAGIPLGRRPRTERSTLSPREREVIELVGQGLTDKQIAAILFISRGTAKVHAKHALEKLAAKTRAEAVRRYYSLEPD